MKFTSFVFWAKTIDNIRMKMIYSLLNIRNYGEVEQYK